MTPQPIVAELWHPEARQTLPSRSDLSSLSSAIGAALSREHALLSHIFDHAWRMGQGPDLATVIRLIQDPRVRKIGRFDLESITPRSNRGKLALKLNNFCATPANAKWLEGQGLDIKSRMYTSCGKPRLSIISTAHLNDAELMFFVTIRAQPRTGGQFYIF